ncbi:MAG: hypothetical protein CL831_10835 [Crocinitomicaceae bacterium]|nr:hypothetical protein [Crocinitomicaceae bacterium]
MLFTIDRKVSHFFEYFTDSPTKEAVKWLPYFEAYDMHLRKFINKKPLILEIGVSRGGSLQFWRDALGPGTRVVGLDINAECKNHEDDGKNIFVEIGDGRNKEFLEYVVGKYGSPDIVIDDGDHNSPSMRLSLNHLWSNLGDGGVYLIEDLHGVFWQEQENWDPSIFEFIFNQIKGLNSRGSRGNVLPTDISQTLLSISCYWSIFVLEKKKNPTAACALSSSAEGIDTVAVTN